MSRPGSGACASPHRSSRRAPGVLTAAFVVLAVLALAASGIPLDGAPRDVTAAEEPFPLTGTTTAPQDPPGPGAAVRVFLVAPDGLLSPSNRSGPSTPGNAVRQLLRGLTQGDIDQALQTRVPNGTSVLGLDGPDAAGVVVVDLSGEFTEVRGEGQVTAVAQVVYTLTDVAGVAAVRFRIEGEDTAVPTQDGTGTTTDPVSRLNYPALDPAERPEPNASVPQSTTTRAPASTAPASTAPASTAPASTAPASTAG